MLLCWESRLHCGFLKGNNIQQDTLVLVRRLLLVVGLTAIFALAAGCRPGAASETNAMGKEGGIVLHYADNTLQAATSIDPANPIMIEVFDTFRVTIISGWASQEGDASNFGVITARVALKAEPKANINTGSYTLVKDSGMLPDALSASLVIEGATMGLPSSLHATSGRLQLKRFDFKDRILHKMRLSFEGTFKANSNGNTEYQLSGVIDLPDKK